MADPRQVQLLLHDLGKRIGISDLTLNESGRCELTINDSLPIEISAGDDDRIVIAALIGEMAADAPPAQYAMLLDANFFWRGTNGATLAVDRDSRAVVLIEGVSLAGLDAPGLEMRLGSFVNSAQAWMDRLAGKAEASDAKDHHHHLGSVILQA
jgi:hypothetical protein